MSAKAPSIGRAIKETTIFLTRIHRDMRQMIETLDDLMTRKRWIVPKMADWVGLDLGNKLKSQWIPDTLRRIYVPKAEVESDGVRALGICEFYLAPPDEYEEAICLCVSAQLKKATPFENVWKAWIWDEADVLGALTGAETEMNIPREVLDNKFIPAANQARAVVIPLERLDAESALIELVVPRLTTVSSPRR